MPFRVRLPRVRLTIGRLMLAIALLALVFYGGVLATRVGHHRARAQADRARLETLGLMNTSLYVNYGNASLNVARADARLGLAIEKLEKKDGTPEQVGRARAELARAKSLRVQFQAQSEASTQAVNDAKLRLEFDVYAAAHPWESLPWDPTDEEVRAWSIARKPVPPKGAPGRPTGAGR